MQKEDGVKPQILPVHRKTIAVIGSGPSGLAAIAQHRAESYSVT